MCVFLCRVWGGSHSFYLFGVDILKELRSNTRHYAFVFGTSHHRVRPAHVLHSVCIWGVFFMFCVVHVAWNFEIGL